MRNDWESWLLAACDPQTRAEPPHRAPGPAELAAALAAAKRHFVLGSTLRSVAAWGIAQDPARAALVKPYANFHLQDAGRTLGLRQLAATVVETFHAADIPCTILKGQDFAARLYPTAALRPFRDVDVLVPRAAHAAADKLVRSLGFKAVDPERKYAAQDYGQISYFANSAEQWSLELHWNVINSPAQRRTCSISWDDFTFEPRQPAGEAGGYARLTPASLLILAAVHACVGHRFDSLQQLCDIRQICRGAAGAIDPTELTDACQRLRCETPVAWSLDLTSRLFGCSASLQLGRSARFSRRVVRPLALLGRQTVMRPLTRGSKLRRSLARLRLKNAA